MASKKATRKPKQDLETEVLCATLYMARAMAALTQVELGAKAGLSNVTVCRLESGERQPSVATLRKWAKACHCRLAITMHPLPLKNKRAADKLRAELARKRP